MNKKTALRLLPTGATTMSGALTCVALLAATDCNSHHVQILTKYETTIRSPYAPVGALYTRRDAALRDGREEPHQQHTAEKKS